VRAAVSPAVILRNFCNMTRLPRFLFGGEPAIGLVVQEFRPQTRHKLGNRRLSIESTALFSRYGKFVFARARLAYTHLASRKRCALAPSSQQPRFELSPIGRPRNAQAHALRNQQFRQFDIGRPRGGLDVESYTEKFSCSIDASQTPKLADDDGDSRQVATRHDERPRCTSTQHPCLDS